MNDEQDRQPSSSFIVHRSSLSGALDQLAKNRNILLFGGKGGVGKTTVSVAAALHFSKTKKTILFTTDPASNLEDLFDRQPATGNLSIETLNAEQLYKKFLDDNLPSFLELGDRGTYLDKEELRRFFELSLPGVDELMAWMRIGELAEENADAMLIVDTAPTGHTLRMLGGAEHFRQFASALDSMQQKHRDMVQQLTRRSVRDAIDQFIDDFEARARRRTELLTDAKRTAFVPVLLSDVWVVEQTKRLIDEVRRDGIDVPIAILNRAAPDCDCARCREQAKRDEQVRKTLCETSPLTRPLRQAQGAPSPDGRGTAESPVLLLPGEEPALSERSESKGGAKRRMRGVVNAVIPLKRACVPLDSPERIAQWSA